MNVYRDDLAAARERIRALEQELESVRAREGLVRHEGDAITTAPPPVRRGVLGARTVIALGAVIAFAMVLRVPALVPVVVILTAITAVFVASRGRTMLVRPNEVAVHALPRGSSTATRSWIGPGQMVSVARSAQFSRLTLRALPLRWTAHAAETEDGDHLDAEVAAVVAVRSDPEGLRRAASSLDATTLPLVAQAGIEDALRTCMQGAAARAVTGRDPAFREQLRRAAKDTLEELGIKLLVVGVIEARATDEVRT